MSLKTLLICGIWLCSTFMVAHVSAEASQSPLRIRINKNILKKIINMRDQEMFKSFKDTEVAMAESSELLEKITYSLSPVDGVDLDDFDLDVSITKEYLGAETDKVKVSGTATLKDGTEVPFTGPVPLVKLQYELGTKLNEKFNVDALHFNHKEWTFKCGELTGEGLSAEVGQEVATAIDKNVDEFKTKFEKGDKKGEMQYIENFPMDTIIPMASLYYVVQFSENFDDSDKFITLGFGLTHYKMLTEKQQKMLKAISYDFYNEVNEEGDDALAQLTIDDNLFNSLSSVFTSMDKTFSARDMMKSNPKLRAMLQTMKTDVIGTVIPTFTEEYGAGKALDIMFSPSHSLFLDGFPNAKMSGIYIDKNGNWKV